ncbi:integrase arm-type DNA-binding domain-containing protein [Rhizobium leguminosarum]|uniref:tyrosine-type recombinase/integrase n=1 Tax=Rhizobium leguminosarum TaxID=384 RepID=UPI001C910F5E|nr:site-specific integrase [Rhizobium leguminosarum]MBY2913959.1 integrase arm-type DNA-binding domain-containing protein [Rhizobium leguminosarum]
MALALNKLSARTVATTTKPGRHSDGGGLYLVVDKSGAKRWVFLYRRDDRLREMGLGGLNAVTLAKARELAAGARANLQAGVDPIEAKRTAPAAVPTFGQEADDFIEAMKPQFRNAKHIAQWEMTLREYAAPLRPKPVNEIATADILEVLKPIWLTKPETASRTRGRIERVLDASRAKGHRTGENPALWRGHLDKLLPKRRKLSRGHHTALPYGDVSEFIAALRKREAIAARALEFTILTAARSGEVFGATWGEISRNAGVWTVPAERMKAGIEHRVPLPPRALDILHEMAMLGAEHDAYVFPGRKEGRPLSVMAMDMVLRRMKIPVTVHGFRSSFRDWCGEASTFPRELAEAALAHVVGDQTERAYRRGDALEKRRKLMVAWANYCEPRTSNVIPMNRSKGA